ncbi:MAG: response regulator [Terricaulis sp.]
MSAVDPNTRIDLSKATALVIDGSQHSLDVISQILKGFGLATILRCDRVQDAEKIVKTKSVDVILIDPSIHAGTGYGFVNALRHGGGPSAYAPVILVSGHVRHSDVSRARNTGANFVVTKPLSPSVLLQRILWIARDKRPFVEVGDYIGPDRRFKFEGPPAGSDGRRSGDLSAPLGEADEPNLSQDEVDAMIKPQRVMI